MQLNRAVVVDYSDGGNGNVSGGESEDDNDDGSADSRKQLASNSRDNEIHSQTHHEIPNEIAESTAETSTPQPVLNITLPCDADRGGCDHECQMLKYYYDPEPVIQCSCYRGFILDELDGRRCHGER